MGTPENQPVPPERLPPAPPPEQVPPVQQVPPPGAPPPAAAAPPAPATPSRFSTFLASMSRAELFIAGGAALVLLTDLIFVIFGPYAFEAVIWVAAALALLAVLLRRRLPAALAANYEWLLLLLTLVAVLPAAREVLYDLIYLGTVGTSGINVSRVIGMIAFYAGIALMAYGAWQIWQRRRA